MKKLLLTATLGLLTFVSFGQQKVLDAFLDSYAQEKLGNYMGAAMSVASVYNPASYEHNLRLGYLKYMCGANNEAITYYSKAIEIMPFAVEPRIGYTLPLAAMESWTAVIEQYNIILKLDPNNTTINYRLGYIYYIRRNYAEALKCFEKIVKLFPFDYHGSLMMGWTHYQMGKMDEAMNYFNRVALNSPTDKSAKEGLDLIRGLDIKKK
jgi:tetratricopeptide (TPR) repeat protein